MTTKGDIKSENSNNNDMSFISLNKAMINVVQSQCDIDRLQYNIKMSNKQLKLELDRNKELNNQLAILKEIVNELANEYSYVIINDSKMITTKQETPTNAGNIKMFGIGTGVKNGKIYPKYSNIENISDVWINGLSTFCLTSKNEIYCTGNNEYGQLGINQKAKKLNTMVINGYFDSIQLISEGVSNSHVFVISHDNVLYGMGNNKQYQIGRSDTAVKSYHPIYVDKCFNLFKGDVVSIQCGECHSLFLDVFGFVYGCGSNNSGQLGHSISKMKTQQNIILIESILEACTSNSKQMSIVSIKCCCRSSLLLTKDGNMISFGDNKFGALGIGKQINVKKTCKPSIIEYFKDKNIIITQFDTGRSHVACLDTNNNVYCFGRNDYKQCGNGNNIIYKPHKIGFKLKVLPLFTQISCGFYHTILVDSCNNIFVWGRNDAGQCGNINWFTSNKPNPHLIPKKIIKQHTNIDGNISILGSRYETIFTYNV